MLPPHAQVPLDPAVSRAAEEGRSAFEGTGAAGRTGALPALRSVIDAVLAAVGEAPMVADGKASGHRQNVQSMQGLVGVPA